jgi:hypothetical protein
MQESVDDLSMCSLEEICNSELTNRERYKQVRLQNTALVKSRLAKSITAEEYAASRKLTTEAARECQRWGAALVREITRRTAG